MKIIKQGEYTLEQAEDGDWNLYKHDVYERGSVLEGQPRRSLRGFYKSPTDALNANPLIYIDVLDHSTKVEHQMSDVPPDWFDPLNAGEEW